MAETVVRRSAGAQPLCGAVGTRVLAVRQRGCGVWGGRGRRCWRRGRRVLSVLGWGPQDSGMGHTSLGRWHTGAVACG